MTVRTTPAVRVATVDDVAALAHLRYEFRISLGEAVESEAAFVARCIPWMTAQLTRTDSWRCWITDTITLAGMIWLLPVPKIPNPVDEPEFHGYVSSFYVRPGARGKGFGSGLLSTCLSACDAEHFDAVFLWPTQRSRVLYQRHGFVQQGELMQRRPPTGDDDAD